MKKDKYMTFGLLFFLLISLVACTKVKKPKDNISETTKTTKIEEKENNEIENKEDLGKVKQIEETERKEIKNIPYDTIKLEDGYIDDIFDRQMIAFYKGADGAENDTNTLVQMVNLSTKRKDKEYENKANELYEKYHALYRDINEYEEEIKDSIDLVEDTYLQVVKEYLKSMEEHFQSFYTHSQIRYPGENTNELAFETKKTEEKINQGHLNIMQIRTNYLKELGIEEERINESFTDELGFIYTTPK